MTGARHVRKTSRAFADVRSVHLALLAMPLLLIAGCKGNQSALDPAGLQAERIYNLWHLFNWVCLAVYVLAMGFVLWAALLRRGRRDVESPQDDSPQVNPDPAREARATVVFSTLMGITALIVFSLLLSDLFTGHRLHSMGQSNDPLVVKVIGHQWWWEVIYDDPTPSRSVTTANELHVPVGRPVRVELTSSDVIHSFWLPNMTGKKDMVPGHPTTVMFEADRAGTFTGNCAEFCGMEHAQMRFTLYADDPDKFSAWLSHQRDTPMPPSEPERQRGLQVFTSSSCVMCHAINGTIARSRTGPDLTNVGGRGTIGAGWIENTPQNMEEWIKNTQTVKPGVRMPPTTMPAADMKALVSYLEGLR